jgi:hypothetical protein
MSRANDYVEHLRSETFPRLAQIPGFVSAQIRRRDLPQGIEFPRDDLGVDAGDRFSPGPRSASPGRRIRSTDRSDARAGPKRRPICGSVASVSAVTCFASHV